jgi:signal transduction histidine kinase
MCILVLAPVGRDAELTCVALREAGLECRPCGTMAELCEGIRAGCGAVLVAEEMFSHEPMETLEQELRNQPQWSDLPIVLLTRGNGSAIETSVVGKALDNLGNVLLLERPTRVGTLVSVCRSAIRARNRQYQILRHVTEIEEAERSLEHRTQELARSNAELQDFAYITSHDLKEPLRGISNYVQFLLEEEGTNLSEQGVERLLTIQRLTRRMYLLLDSLLEYSRAGRVDFALAMQSVETIVDEVLDTMGPWLEEKGAQVVIHRPLPTVLCDRVRVGQVFTNLIANAVKYNDNPVRRVEVGCERGPDGPIFYVRDNGIGIPPRHHETVFRMFRRLHARDQYGGGTGAGLPLVKRVVERHGGRIWIDSDMGKGATFYFTFGNPQAPASRLLRMNGASVAADGRPHRDASHENDAPPPRNGSPNAILQTRSGPGAAS